MKNWDEIRTALHVAQKGTVSGAAESLGVHHATVIRHIDALEQHLGAKLFTRHSRGYTTTEAGKELLQVAQVTQDQFSQLANRLSGNDTGVTGELVITSLAVLSPVLTPILAAFRNEYPHLSVRFLTGARVFRLEYGEAHVAIRAGAAPIEPDNVVQAFGSMPCGLYAAQSYLDIYGCPESVSDLKNHGFVTYNGPSTAPFANWMNENIP